MEKIAALGKETTPEPCTIDESVHWVEVENIKLMRTK